MLTRNMHGTDDTSNQHDSFRSALLSRGRENFFHQRELLVFRNALDSLDNRISDGPVLTSVCLLG